MDNTMKYNQEPVWDVLESYILPTGWGWALVSTFKDGDTSYAGKDQNKVVFEITRPLFIPVPVTEEAAAEYLRSIEGGSVVGPDGSVVRLGGSATAALRIAKLRHESERGILRQMAMAGEEVGAKEAQEVLLKLRTRTAKKAVVELDRSKTYTPEEVADLIRRAGGAVTQK